MEGVTWTDASEDDSCQVHFADGAYVDGLRSILGKKSISLTNDGEHAPIRVSMPPLSSLPDPGTFLSADAETLEFLRRRRAFVMRYCKQHGLDPDELSIEQIME
jgi:hypothetical protein